MEVQVFGTNKSAETRKALRFFSERRVKTHFVNLAIRAASVGELARFAHKFGASMLIDRDARCFFELGLQYTVLSEQRWIQKLAEHPRLLRIPLVRNGRELTIGADEATWKNWLARAGKS